MTAIQSPDPLDPALFHGGIDRERSTNAEPADLDLEASILGALVSSPAPDVIAAAAAELTVDDFYDPVHELLWKSLEHLWNGGNAIDPNSVRVTALELDHKIGARVTMRLVDITTRAVIPASLPWHISKLRDVTVRRFAARAGARLHAAAQQQSDDPSADLARTISDLQSLTRAKSQGAHLFQTIEEVIHEVDQVASGNITPGIDTGLPDLDRVHCGMRPGQMIVIGARPGVGKTTLALTIARHVGITEQKLVHFVSLEMSRQELAYRILSAEANVPLEGLRSGQMDDRHWNKIARAHARMMSSKVMISDDGAQSISSIHAASKALASDGLALIVVDYLQLVTSSRKDANRYAEVSEISRNVKMMAKDLKVPVIVLSQLSRRSETAGSERLPGLADLRDSSAIESDADAVWLLHKSDEQEDPASLGEVSLIVAKNRHGPTATVTLANRSHVATFSPLARNDAGAASHW